MKTAQKTPTKKSSPAYLKSYQRGRESGSAYQERRMKNTDQFDFQLPSLPHVEVTLLGSMLMDQEACEEATLGLEPDDFSLDSNQRIFKAILHVIQSGSPVEYLTVRDVLEKRKELAAIGNHSYLLSLTEGIPRYPSITEYIKLLKNTSRRRHLIMMGHELMLAAGDGSDDASTLSARFKQRIEEVENGNRDGLLRPIRMVMNEREATVEKMVERPARAKGVPCHLKEVDTALAGYQPGDLILLAARPSSGKSSYIENAMDHASRICGRSSALFILEGSIEQSMSRIYCGISGVDTTSLRAGTLDQYQIAELKRAESLYTGVPLFATDATGLTATKIASECRILKRKLQEDGDDLYLVGIDQRSHISLADVYQPGMKPHDAIGAQLKILKAMAKELHVPVVLLNQLLRGDGSRPTLSDLKGSGSLEEDADVVIFLHRPGYYDRENESLFGVGEVIIEKQRQGSTGVFNVVFNERLCLWVDDKKVPY